MGQNIFGDQGTGFAWWAALLLEVLDDRRSSCTVILAVTDARNEQPALGPLAIGLTLAMIHFASIPLTGTSVNPARSIGVGVFAGTDAIVQLWLFILAPLLGAAIAGLTYPILFGHGAEPVAGSGLNFGGGRKDQFVPGNYEAQWNQGAAGQLGPARRRVGRSPAAAVGPARPLPAAAAAARPRLRRTAGRSAPAARPAGPVGPARPAAAGPALAAAARSAQPGQSQPGQWGAPQQPGPPASSPVSAELTRSLGQPRRRRRRPHPGATPRLRSRLRSG